jgi:hypothetical protein
MSHYDWLITTQKGQKKIQTLKESPQNRSFYSQDRVPSLWHFFRVQAIDQRHTKHKYIHTLFIYYIYMCAYLKMCRFLCGVLGQLVSDKRKVLNFFDIRIVGFSNYYK